MDDAKNKLIKGEIAFYIKKWNIKCDNLKESQVFVDPTLLDWVFHTTKSHITLKNVCLYNIPKMGSNNGTIIKITSI